MSGSQEKIDIVVGKFPADAALLRTNGVRTLFMGTGQTFSRAVDNVMNVLPGITREAAERMIREQCPEFPDLDDMLGLNAPAPPSIERPPVDLKADVTTERLPDTGKRRRKVFIVAALLPALAASWALGRYTNVADPAAGSVKASAPDATPEQGPFNSSKFTKFAGAGDIDCETINTLQAECTDADGMVMSTKAATGPDGTIFTFSYGSQRIGLRIFYDVDYADTWARQDASKAMYPHMEKHGRYVLWGTDSKRIREYGELLDQAERDNSPGTAMRGMAPLPPRLAALTLGTLGLDAHQVNQIIAQPSGAVIDGPVMMAARLCLGLDTAPPFSTRSIGDDIVAIAAGLDQVPPVAPPIVNSPAVALPVSDTPSASSTGGTGTSTSPPPSSGATTPPAGDTKTPTAPAEPTPPPVEQPSTPSTPTAPTGPTEPTTPTGPTEPTQPIGPTEPTFPAKPSDPGTGTPTDPEPSDPAPSEPEEPIAPPVEETPPPVEDTPAPIEDVPAEDAPAEETPAAPADTVDEDQGDVLILDSAWTVAA
ncbi:hypothetical protein ACIBAC_00465 [Streptomyces sp. NPDC051362]|uniref:hypothetical protein n=1 Tax=Streptomyces sp. NPDC051362 TaxID=3365651 RepID=UPI0037890346